MKFPEFSFQMGSSFMVSKLGSLTLKLLMRFKG
jgi:hypothetical protein